MSCKFWQTSLIGRPDLQLLLSRKWEIIDAGVPLLSTTPSIPVYQPDDAAQTKTTVTKSQVFQVPLSIAMYGRPGSST
ncbi:hypothetical protein SNOG_01970 [Parastagonospora nodorum SN15]|uniref:Uncharacterized protein n=1 Tax=Phaeosphaeria nodorum (strain SN15 / ATCC MYA-4574 / FGSC 10173) TaxID=321614 RepID=Q0V1Z4_PHANO|nr:hypothetical protein SNOG_01970 [Parastagonospora nodorum SN15]EAT90182.1 hypothetical protein SNOG_01970 [Parastagonospora nodorum SN15]